MFRKIVTELAYSPALAGSLGGHIKRLRQERSRRQIGLIFICLAIVVQLFATISPPESVNANNPSLFIEKELASIDEYLNYYDDNTRNIKELFSSLGITRSDIAATSLTTLPASVEASIWLAHNNRGEATSSYAFKIPTGKTEMNFYQPFDASAQPIEVFASITEEPEEWFAITKYGGNLITNYTPEGCSPWYLTSLDSTDACPSSIDASLSARTIMPSAPMDGHTAKASDRIAYRISATNKSDIDTSITPAINLEDALEYSRILDNGGGEYDYDTKMLSWPTSTLPAGQTIERDFIIQLLPAIPSTARSEYIPASYDCTLRVSFGDTVTTPVDCPATKYVETLTSRFFAVPREINFVFAGFLLLISAFLYARSRQLLTELYIIRHNHLGGL